MIKRFPVILLTLFTAACARPGNQPLAVAKKIFSKEADPHFIQLHSTGDYQGHPNGEDLPAGVQPSFRILRQTATNSVIAMNLAAVGPHADKYLFFSKDSGIWQLNAIGAPTLARADNRRKQEMESLTETQIDSILQESQQYSSPAYKTREAFDFILHSLRLKLSPDDTLVAHFNRHKAGFEQLLAAAQQVNYTLQDDRNTLADSRTPAYQSMLISNVTKGGFLPEQCFDFHILYDQVGYLYVADERYLPELRPDKVMMLRKVGKGWYLYKVAIYL
ncbi:hypothetical protein [Chitinophaga rhizophila]|uniref:Uncharacterized protein n=1 Tax=Chitinophaga rhizophila TaxID=2866212 RepID=A0ABS7GKF7_9BACT|nr:hypothetical protein [Chitinophaga rhizophila]MBW8688209.1 hypothetical protein [Chitinophaga rhizophila]